MSYQPSPIFPHPPKEGAWLCAEGPYLDFISKICKLSPGISSPDPKSKHVGSRVGQSRSVVLELQSDVTWRCKSFANADEIKDHLSASSNPPGEPAVPHHRIYILEGLDPTYVEAYGSHFFMDPSFFVRQERNDLWNVRNLGSHMLDPPTLPSSVDPETFFGLKYREVRQFGPQLKHWRTVCALTGRHLSAIGFDGSLDSVAAVARRFSFFSRSGSNGGWDVVILCDPPILHVHVKIPEIGRHTPMHSEIFQSEPFQGGYYDFIKRPSYDPNALQSLEAPPRTSLLDDICFYFEHHPQTISINSPQHEMTSLNAAVIPIKIICAHYMKLIDYFEVVLARLARIEWQLSRQSDYADYPVRLADEQWSSLHLSKGRLSTYIDDVEEILKDIVISPNANPPPKEWDSIEKDLKYILRRLQKMKTRVEESVSAAMGFSNIVGSKQALSEARQSVKEAKSTKTLTIVGLVFIPLAYTCSLFSMSDEFRPGSRLFWVYFVVSLPLILLVFLGTFLIRLGYDENATWSFGQFKKTFSAGFTSIASRARTTDGEKAGL